MRTDWRLAHFLQAQSDYALFKRLDDPQVPICHRLHYLQMTTEKMAKGFLTPPGGPRPERVHNAFVRFVRLVQRTPALRRVCDCKPDQMEAYVNSLLPIAAAVEDLVPVGDQDRPNPEYPWQAGANIFVPVSHAFSDFDPKTNPKMRKLLVFIEKCFQLISEESTL
jgi:hypothetical protein